MYRNIEAFEEAVVGHKVLVKMAVTRKYIFGIRFYERARVISVVSWNYEEK